MISYTSNISQVVRLQVNKLNDFAQGDQLLRTIAYAVLPELKKRVHVEGKDSSGNQIGTYSAPYMVLRTGAYKKADKVRPKYNRTADTKVIASLTRQMENDLSVIPVGKGYGIGYNNPLNYQKSQWVEQTYKKRIWGLTEGEKQLTVTVANEFISNAFH
jgi:hypothetical protein